MKWLAVVVLMILVAACTVSRPVPATVHRLTNAEIHGATCWSGVVVIDGWVKVLKGATLTLLPGTEVRFVRRDDDKDGLGDGTIVVEGSLQALGTRTAPIRFCSDAVAPRAGDWLELRVDFSREVRLRYCEIRDSAHTLHAHFTRAVVEDSHIHHNIDGCRLGQGNFTLRHNLIEDNEGKGINFRNASVDIRANIIRRNGSGIFLFETDRPPQIAGNNLYDNGDNLRLGDFFHTDVTVGDNWWGSADPETVAATIYDRRRDPSLGRVSIAIAPEWQFDSGPRDVARLQETALVPTDGFVDAAPLIFDDKLVVASWDGSVRCTDAHGVTLWTTKLGEPIDATLAQGQGLIFGQSWGREVFALDQRNGARRWTYRYPASPADDHRQGGVVLAGSLLLVPAWNGTLYAFEAATGRLCWSFAARAPLRAEPLVVGDTIILPGGDGTLWCLDLTGQMRWQQQLAAPLLSRAAAIEGGLAVLDRDGTLSAYDVSGAQLWRQPLDGPCYYAAPVAAGTDLFVATGAGTLWRLSSRTGAVIWRRGGLGPSYATPLLQEGRLVVADNAGGLSLFSAESGATLGRLTLGAPLQGSPRPYRDGVAVGSRDHAVHLFTLTVGEPGVD